MNMIKPLVLATLLTGASTASLAEQFTINYPVNPDNSILYIALSATCQPPSGNPTTTNFGNVPQSPSPSFIFFSSQLNNCPTNSKVTVKFANGSSGSCPEVTLTGSSSTIFVFNIVATDSKSLSCKPQ
ncbi:MAG: hypothetical protein HWD59_07760 [Coxiellaceae bacterium]|nr:MAG: hypothetical protein HWD59_07760 [Coxiellaceae bacterium]